MDIRVSRIGNKKAFFSNGTEARKQNKQKNVFIAKATEHATKTKSNIAKSTKMGWIKEIFNKKMLFF